MNTYIKEHSMKKSVIAAVLFAFALMVPAITSAHVTLIQKSKCSCVSKKFTSLP